MFTRSEVIMLTNKQTNPPTNKQKLLKTSNALRYATTLGKYSTKSQTCGHSKQTLYDAVLSTKYRSDVKVNMYEILVFR